MIFSSIKTKMTLSVFLLVLFLALVTAVLAFLYFENNIKGNISNQQFAVLFYTARRYFLFDGIAAALFSALLAWAVMTHLTAPLLAFTQSIKNIADGKAIQKPAPIISGNEMTEALKESEDKFKRIAEQVGTILDKRNEKENKMGRCAIFHFL